MTKHEAFWRQARSDFAVFEVLARQDRSPVPACHPLHYLQMAVEKLGKAAAIKMDPSYAERTHKPLSDLVRLLKRRDAAKALGYSDFKHFLDSLTHGAVPLLTYIQDLHPQETPDGSNVEYPWFGRDAHGAEEWHAPADESFPLLAKIWRGVGQDKRLLPLIRDLLERFDSVF